MNEDDLKKDQVILVVDDDADFREILRKKLEAVGFKIEEAHSGRDAVEKAFAVQPVVVVLDVEMPDMNGVETLTYLRGQPALKDTQFVFLTNYGDTVSDAGWVDEKFARDIGAHEYIKKSNDLDTIVDEIVKVVRRGRG